MIPERDTEITPSSVKQQQAALAHRAISGRPNKQTVQSSPVKSQPAMISSGLDKNQSNISNSNNHSTSNNNNNFNKKINTNGLSSSTGNLLNCPSSPPALQSSYTEQNELNSHVSHLKQQFSSNGHHGQSYNQQQGQHNQASFPPQSGKNLLGLFLLFRKCGRTIIIPLKNH